LNKQDVIEFFDRLAPWWDADMIRDDAIIATILDNAGVSQGKRVLDVACGTGVLFGDYLARKVASLTAIDISPEMAKIAASKFPQARVLCGDALTEPLPGPFDCIVVYNAFPHFPQPEKLIEVLSGYLAPGGSLTVAHGMSRAAIDAHHHGAAAKVSVGLMHEDDLAALMEKTLTVKHKISNEKMYQVTAVKS
jgi:demethylmenaquinone methyltransferase/2-methoxy-6-polyprenyl-1,4-benzoquinol methylase